MSNNEVNLDEMRKQYLSEVAENKRNSAKRFIYVTFQREGIHCYPQAATDPNLQDVSFLANPHRHIFHFKVEIQVYHNDREIEFIQFKRYLESLFNQGVLALNNKSCEMISDELYISIATKYPTRQVTITVSEDGENGATIFYS
jgi:hypothetical protein